MLGYLDPGSGSLIASAAAAGFAGAAVAAKVGWAAGDRAGQEEQGARTPRARTQRGCTRRVRRARRRHRRQLNRRTGDAPCPRRTSRDHASRTGLVPRPVRRGLLRR